GSNAYVATARAFPDGLVAGAAVAATGGVLYLVDGLGLSGSPESLTALEDAGLRRLRIVGGNAAVSDAVEADLVALLGEAAPPREYAIAGTEYNGMQIVDITNPRNARIASVYDCGTLQGDIQVFEQGDRTLATFTSENTSSLVIESRCVQDAVAAGDVDGAALAEGDRTSAYGTYVVDITDPLDPVYGGFIPVPEGSHNGTVHPSGDWFYNSDSALIDDVTPQIQIYDISALPEVTRVGEVDLPVRPGLGTSSHDLTFNADGSRMYAAALSQTIIYDTTDPAAPVEVSSWIDPAINVEHQADPIDLVDSEGNERTLLLVEDELAGAAGNGFCPGGGVHIYDITGDNELDPMLHKVGTYFIPEFRPAGTGSGEGEAITCTAHVFRIHPEQQIMTIAWYNAGVWVLDLSGLADAATPLDEPIQTLGYAYFDNSDTWSFKTNRIEEDGSFYAYGNDIIRGLDVYRFDATADGGADLAEMQGRFVNQPTAIAMADRAAIANGLLPGEVDGPRCLLIAADS
ncbi:MAG TPA: cell wall-binding repeat-containing protein, partial [Euzebya sp.]|nr:cell wall-binding repeat-containing protein [Euzebya sp.]